MGSADSYHRNGSLGPSSRKPVDVEKYCPFGGLEAFGSYLTNHSLACSMSMLQIMMGFALVAGILLCSKLFCGYLCPLGTLGETMGRLGRKLRLQVEFRQDSIVDKLLRAVKYVLLFTILYNTLATSELFVKNSIPTMRWQRDSRAKSSCGCR